VETVEIVSSLSGRLELRDDDNGAAFEYSIAGEAASGAVTVADAVDGAAFGLIPGAGSGNDREPRLRLAVTSGAVTAVFQILSSHAW
jgi:hypothetical protein